VVDFAAPTAPAAPAATAPDRMETCRVAVIGGGPAGLAAATALARAGVRGVVLLEHEAEAGGIPRHCGHSPFGMRELRRVHRGPKYAAKLASRARQAGVDIRAGTTVAAAAPRGILSVATAAGATQLRASRVILCTGARETPRGARLVSGARPLGVLTTGALQALVYLQRQIPFTRPLIVGSELVAFSALLTCRHAGIRPVALIESGARIAAWRGAALLPKLLGVPLYRRTRLLDIRGAARVTGARVADAAGAVRRLDCDGVLFTGQFTPESALAQSGHLEIDRRGGPAVDRFGRCSDPAYFAAGNARPPLKTAGQCWRDGVAVARHVQLDLAGRLPAA